MRRPLLCFLLTVATGLSLVLVLALVVELRVEEVELAAPDVNLPIQLPDGSSMSLGQVLERTLAPARAPVEALLPGETPPAGADAGAQLAEVGALYPGMPWGPLFALGERQRQAGRLDQALALFQSIPPDDPDYSIARRRIALQLMQRGETDAAVGAIKQALAADPWGGNAWQDTARVYGHALGLPID